MTVNQPGSTTHTLAISVIVNTNDRAAPLQTLLKSLEHQSYPHFEVIVVVGPTNDNTLDVVAAYGARVRVLRCPEANLSISRNIGVVAARGEVVAFIDDDAVPCRTWLQQLADCFSAPQIDATGGAVLLIHPNRPLTQFRLGVISALAELVDVRDSWLDQLAPPAGVAALWSPRMMGSNMAFRRLPLLAIGGFDENYAYGYEDPDAAMRITIAGGSVLPLREAPVYHVPASSRYRVGYTLNQHWWLYTKTGVYFSIKHARTGRESRSAIAKRCLYLIHGHWRWAGELYADGKLTAGQQWRMRVQEVRYGLWGIYAGFFSRRRLLSQRQVAEATNQEQVLRPYLNDQSAMQPSVDPVSGQSARLEMPSPPLRLCLLSQTYPPEKFDGVGRSTNLLARGLAELGHHVHVITRGEHDQVSFYAGAYVHRIAPPLTRYTRYRLLPVTHHTLNYSHGVYEKLRALVLNDGVQLVDSPLWQVEGLVTVLSHLLPVVVRPVTAARQIAELQHNRDRDMAMIGDLEQALLERADFLAANSQATVKALQTVYHLPGTTPYGVIPYGIAPVPDEAVRPFKLDQPPGVRTVLFLGRLEKRKGILDLFAAIPRVLAATPHVQFVIAGADNSQSDGFQARNGMNYATWFARQNPALAASVRFLGAVGDDELNRLYQQCDLFVAPSLYESFGLIYLEAMNYAKPVIGCNAGGIPEVVDDGVTGLLVEPEAPAALAEAIVRLVRSPQQLHDLGVAGRYRLLDRFSYQHMARGFAQAYRSVLLQKESQSTA